MSKFVQPQPFSSGGKRPKTQVMRENLLEYHGDSRQMVKEKEQENILRIYNTAPYNM